MTRLVWGDPARGWFESKSFAPVGGFPWGNCQLIAGPVRGDAAWECLKGRGARLRSRRELAKRRA